MQVNAISFKGVYRVADKQFTPLQYSVSEKIKNRLVSPEFADKQRHTPDYKLSKQGYDVILSPRDENLVDVSIVTNLKKGVGIEPHTYRESTFIGTYDASSEFDPKDIYEAIDHKNSFRNIFLIPIIGIMVIIANGFIKKCSDTQNNITKIENTIVKDSTKDSAKTFVIDTLKVVKK